MSGAVHSFLGALIDYAGLFPPAGLAVPAAVAEYARHRSEPEAWMLGRFIAPVGRLTEIGREAQSYWTSESHWPFSVLIGDRQSGAAALAAVPGQVRSIADFVEAYPGRVAVECLESPLPLDTPESMAEFVPIWLSALQDAGLKGQDLFLELPAGGDDGGLLRAIAAASPDYGGFRRIGAKLRCGGVTAEAFPSCERVAAVIHAAAQLDLPLKCTAGLHHPVRHLAAIPAATPPVMMHGFLNVFGAGVLAWALQLGLDDLVACVAETDPDAFTLNESGFSWREHRVTAAAVHRIREHSLCGFGSCSFAEPRSDLRDLNIL